MIIGMVCEFSFNAYAIEQVRDEYEAERQDNINNTLLYLGYGENDAIHLLEYQVESNEKEKSIVFVFEDDKMIGQYVSEKRDEETYECFIVDDSEKLFNMINSGNDFYLIENQEGMMIAAGDNEYILSEK